MYQHSRRSLARSRSSGALASTASVGIYSRLGGGGGGVPTPYEISSTRSSTSMRGGSTVTVAERVLSNVGVAGVALAGIVVTSIGIGIVTTTTGRSGGAGGGKEERVHRRKGTRLSAGCRDALRVRVPSRMVTSSSEEEEGGGGGAAVYHRASMSSSSNEMRTEDTASIAELASSSLPTAVVVSGLPNLGNSCFVNALLQAVASIPTFREYLKQTLLHYGYKTHQEIECLSDESGSLIAALALCLDELSPRTIGGSRSGAPMIGTTPSSMLRDRKRHVATRVYPVLRILREELENKMSYYDQQDAQEMFHYLMEILEVDSGRLASANDDDDDNSANDKKKRRRGTEEYERDGRCSSETKGASMRALYQKRQSGLIALDLLLLSATGTGMEEERGNREEGETGRTPPRSPRRSHRPEIAPADEGGGGRDDTPDEKIEDSSSSSSGRRPSKRCEVEEENDHENTFSRADTMTTSRSPSDDVARRGVLSPSAVSAESTRPPPRNPLQGLMASSLRCAHCGRMSPIKLTPFFDLSIIVPTRSNAVGGYNDDRDRKPRVGLFLGEEEEEEGGGNNELARIGVGSSGVTAFGADSIFSSDRRATQTLRDCLRNFTAEEHLDQVECETCKTKHRLDRLRRRMRLAIDEKIRADLAKEIESLSRRMREFVMETELRGATDRHYHSSPPSSIVAVERPPAVRRDVLTRVPPALCLHVRRRRYCPISGTYVKIRDHVKFDLILQVAPFCDRDLSGSTSHPPYRLQAVVVHSGSANGGHFSTYRRVSIGSREVWMYASDAITRTASIAEVLQSQAYMLFYERVSFGKTPLFGRCDGR